MVVTADHTKSIEEILDENQRKLSVYDENISPLDTSIINTDVALDYEEEMK